MLCVPRLSAELLISKNQCPADFPADLRGLGSLALPSLPLSAVTLPGRKRRISRSTDGHLLFHCYYCIEPYVLNHAHLRGETWMKLKLSRAGNLTLRFPDRRLHVCIICANSKSKNCHTFIITSPVSTDTWQNNHHKISLLLILISPRFEQRVLVTAVCVLQN